MGYKAKVSKSELWKAIRNHCLICSGGSRLERANCAVVDCSLYPFRLGLRGATCKKQPKLEPPQKNISCVKSDDSASGAAEDLTKKSKSAIVTSASCGNTDLGTPDQKLIQTQDNNYLVPNVCIVGFGRTIALQIKCLRCGKLFFYEQGRLFCESCEGRDDNKKYIKPKNKSKHPMVGNIVGTIQKTAMSKRRCRCNYKKVILRDNFICQYCGYDFNAGHNVGQLTIDHIRPFANGGSNHADNMVVACKKCNCSACDKVFDSFFDKKQYIIAWRKERGLPLYPQNLTVCCSQNSPPRTVFPQ